MIGLTALTAVTLFLPKRGHKTVMPDSAGKDRATPNAAAPAMPPIVVKLAPDQAKIKNAKKRHNTRFREQALLWGVVVVLAAACHPLQRWLKIAHSENCGAASFGIEFECFLSTYILFSILFLAIGFSVWLYHITRYTRNSKKRWNRASGAAMASNRTDLVVDGYTSLFDVYVATKRRSYHLLGLGFLSMLYAITAFAAGWGLSKNSFTYVAFGAIDAMCVLVSILLLTLSRRIGSSYLPGDLLVKQMTIITTKMNFTTIKPDELDKKVNEVLEKFETEKPWYFYDAKGERVAGISAAPTLSD